MKYTVQLFFLLITIHLLQGTKVFSEDIPTATDHAILGDQEVCEKISNALGSTVDSTLLYACMDFYWHRGDLDDPPASFNKRIKIGLRLIELNPANDVNLYIDVATDMYSQWIQWQKDQNFVVDGGKQLKQSVELLIQGQRNFPEDATYHLQTGMFLFQFYLAAKRFDAPFKQECLIKANEFLNIADLLATLQYEKQSTISNSLDPEPKSKEKLDNLKQMSQKIRLQLGRLHRTVEDRDQALAWYKKVLEIDTRNETALKYIENLSIPKTKD